MKSATGIAAATCLVATAMLSGLAVGQGHYEAAPEQTDKVSRSSEYKSDEKAYSVPVEVQLEYKSNDCEARLSLEYFQRGENAQVNSTLTNGQCAASQGTYTIQVRYRGDDGELKTRDFAETWSREDAEPVLASKQYFVGEDVDLVRVRSRRLTCTCNDAAAAGQAETQ